MKKECEKLSLVCNHLLKGKRQRAFLVLEDEPVDKRDTGKIYTCIKCAQNEPKTQKQFMKMLTTCCMHCLRNRNI